jgi:hypothetical protein
MAHSAECTAHGAKVGTFAGYVPCVSENTADSLAINAPVYRLGTAIAQQLNKSEGYIG